MNARALVCVSASICTPFLVACSSPSFVDRVTIDNSTAYWANVDVTDGDREGRLSLTFVDATSERTVEHVVDQGDRWIFRFDYAGRYEEEVEFSRQELEHARWRVEIPPSFEEALQDMGVPPPP